MTKTEKKKLLYKLKMLEALVVMDDSIEDHLYYCSLINNIVSMLKRSH